MNDPYQVAGTFSRHDIAGGGVFQPPAPLSRAQRRLLAKERAAYQKQRKADKRRRRKANYRARISAAEMAVKS